jgi:hypothetical protein
VASVPRWHPHRGRSGIVVFMRAGRRYKEREGPVASVPQREGPAAAVQQGELRPVAVVQQGELRPVAVVQQGELRPVAVVQQGELRPVAVVQQRQRDTMDPPLTMARLRVDAILIHPAIKYASSDGHREIAPPLAAWSCYDKAIIFN